jgi:hypothetical protein
VTLVSFEYRAYFFDDAGKQVSCWFSVICCQR